jgi:hypothetical protein
MKKIVISICFGFLILCTSSAQKKTFVIHTVAFYNFENLFDTINDATTHDEEWTPKGTQQWDSKKYNQKLINLARVLAEIGTADNSNAPTFIGGVEIENRSVLEDLVIQPKLIDKEYGIIHFDSPDKRGIDVALLYQKKQFQPTSYINIPLLVYKSSHPENEVKKVELQEELETDSIVQVNATNYRVYTRDQLLVTGFLNGEELHIIVNHWPSRSGGEKKTSIYREAAGALNRKIIDSLQQINPKAKVITMGDFNDSPFNKSLKTKLRAKGKISETNTNDIFNPFEEMARKGLGTIAFRDSWDIFDQILVSGTLLQKEYSSFQYWKAGVYNKPFLIQQTGKYKGYPLRHSQNEIGFSDHFPVYVYLIKEKK